MEIQEIGKCISRLFYLSKDVRIDNPVFKGGEKGGESNISAKSSLWTQFSVILNMAAPKYFFMSLPVGHVRPRGN